MDKENLGPIQSHYKDSKDYTASVLTNEEKIMPIETPIEILIEIPLNLNKNYQFHIYMEKADGDLLDFMCKKPDYFSNPVNYRSFMKIMIDVCRDFQMQEFAHRDLKTASILWFSQPQDTFKIADFGIAKNVSSKLTTKLQGTKDYMSPESFQTKQIGGDFLFRHDVYAMRARKRDGPCDKSRKKLKRSRNCFF